MNPAYHLRDFCHECGAASCSRPATKELRNRANQVINYYCSSHAAGALRDALAREDRKRTGAAS